MTKQRVLLRINLVIILSFFVVKFLIRPFVLKNDFPEIFDIFVLSYPNFCEAVAGTIVLVFIFLNLNSKILSFQRQFKAPTIYILATLLAGVYVVLQEMKVHNLGGNNVYDPYDLLFSVIGLCTVYILLRYLKPTTIDN